MRKEFLGQLYQAYQQLTSTYCCSIRAFVEIQRCVFQLVLKVWTTLNYFGESISGYLDKYLRLEAGEVALSLQKIGFRTQVRYLTTVFLTPALWWQDASGLCLHTHPTNIKTHVQYFLRSLIVCWAKTFVDWPSETLIKSQVFMDTLFSLWVWSCALWLWIFFFLNDKQLVEVLGMCSSPAKSRSLIK